MKRGLATISIAACAAALAPAAASPAAFAQDDAAGELPAPAEQEIGLLFTQTAKRGSLERVEGSGDRARYALTLNGVARQTVWFQDRPGRQAGQIPTPGFVRSWAGFGFAADPPNAALTLLDAAAHEDTVVLTLGRPRYDRPTHTLRYPARILEAATGNLAHFEPGRDARVPRRFGHASLFVDDAVAPVIDGCVIEPATKCPGADLRGADLHGADLSFAFLPLTNLSGANLSDTRLANANLTNANLTNATLTNANLSRTNFTAAVLTKANLTGANLYYANLSVATLTNANFTNADLTDAIVRDYALAPARLCHTTMPDGSTNNRNC